MKVHERLTIVLRDRLSVKEELFLRAANPLWELPLVGKIAVFEKDGQEDYAAKVHGCRFWRSWGEPGGIILTTGGYKFHPYVRPVVWSGDLAQLIVEYASGGWRFSRIENFRSPVENRGL
jgi:hypothetical protein